MDNIIIEYGTFENMNGYYIEVREIDKVLKNEYCKTKKQILSFLSDYKNLYKNYEIQIINNY